jgi:hypothetical protein
MSPTTHVLVQLVWGTALVAGLIGDGRVTRTVTATVTSCAAAPSPTRGTTIFWPPWCPVSPPFTYLIPLIPLVSRLLLLVSGLSESDPSQSI